MAGHAYLSQIKDEFAAKAIGKVMSDLAAVQSRITQLEAAALRNTAAINANEQRIVNLGTPSADGDAATVAFVKAYVNARLEAF